MIEVHFLQRIGSVNRPSLINQSSMAPRFSGQISILGGVLFVSESLRRHIRILIYRTWYISSPLIRPAPSIWRAFDRYQLPLMGNLLAKGCPGVGHLIMQSKTQNYASVHKLPSLFQQNRLTLRKERKCKFSFPEIYHGQLLPHHHINKFMFVFDVREN